MPQGQFNWLLARPRARRFIGTALAALIVVLLLFNLRRLGKRAGRAAEGLENFERTHAIQRQILEAANWRPRSCSDLLADRAALSSDRVPSIVRPPVVEYNREEQRRMANEAEALPDDSVIVRWLADYVMLRGLILIEQCRRFLFSF